MKVLFIFVQKIFSNKNISQNHSDYYCVRRQKMCLAMTSALSGRGVLAMLRGIRGAVRVALLLAAS